jgi:hypothetical protein
VVFSLSIQIGLAQPQLILLEALPTAHSGLLDIAVPPPYFIINALLHFEMVGFWRINFRNFFREGLKHGNL